MFSPFSVLTTTEQERIFINPISSEMGHRLRSILQLQHKIQIIKYGRPPDVIASVIMYDTYICEIEQLSILQEKKK
jgi:hypothetical protein